VPSDDLVLLQSTCGNDRVRVVLQRRGAPVFLLPCSCYPEWRAETARKEEMLTHLGLCQLVSDFQCSVILTVSVVDAAIAWKVECWIV
jgi:hypothetical protein